MYDAILTLAYIQGRQEVHALTWQKIQLKTCLTLCVRGLSISACWTVCEIELWVLSHHSSFDDFALQQGLLRTTWCFFSEGQEFVVIVWERYFIRFQVQQNLSILILPFWGLGKDTAWLSTFCMAILSIEHCTVMPALRTLLDFKLLFVVTLASDICENSQL